MLEASIAARTTDIEREQASLQRFTETKTKEALSLGNRIAAMQAELQVLVAATGEEEKRVERLVGGAIERSATAAQVTLACENLLRRIDRSTYARGQPPEKQLEIVSEYVQDLRSIVDGFKASAAEGTATPTQQQ